MLRSLKCASALAALVLVVATAAPARADGNLNYAVIRLNPVGQDCAAEFTVRNGGIYPITRLAISVQFFASGLALNTTEVDVGAFGPGMVAGAWINVTAACDQISAYRVSQVIACKVRGADDIDGYCQNFGLDPGIIPGKISW